MTMSQQNPSSRGVPMYFAGEFEAESWNSNQCRRRNSTVTTKYSRPPSPEFTTSSNNPQNTFPFFTSQLPSPPSLPNRNQVAAIPVTASSASQIDCISPYRLHMCLPPSHAEDPLNFGDTTSAQPSLTNTAVQQIDHGLHISFSILNQFTALDLEQLNSGRSSIGTQELSQLTAYALTEQIAKASPMVLRRHAPLESSRPIRDMYSETPFSLAIRERVQSYIEELPPTRGSRKCWRCRKCLEDASVDAVVEMHTKMHAQDHVYQKHFSSYVKVRFQCKYSGCGFGNMSETSMQKHCASKHSGRRSKTCECGFKGRGDYVRGKHREHCHWWKNRNVLRSKRGRNN